MNNEYKNLQEAFYDLCNQLKDAPEVNSRGSKQREKTFCSFTISDPSDLAIDIPGRKFSVNYAVAEWLWYVSANPNINNIGKMASIWKDIADPDQNVESNYGKYFSPQWGWVKRELLSDPDTRRATVVINQPYHKHKNEKDYPCTHYVQFFIRDNKLHMGANMRSNDLVFGFCNDVFTFCLFQQLMLNELRNSGLNIELGSYFHHAGSLHVYERHYGMVDNIISSGPYKNPEQKFVLDESFSLLDCICLPGIDLSKQEINEYVQHARRLLFNEHS